ncbi:MAG: hypothetical protein IKP40_01085 [Clostridia bacterium]|nr:hypothetical protein [Clostridia bacterium]
MGDAPENTVHPAASEALTDEERALEARYERRFSGQYSHSLDGKGRVVVPQPFRPMLGERFTIVPSMDFSSISLYRSLDWLKRRDAYEQLRGKLNPKLIRYLEWVDGLTYRDQEFDGQGRVLLPIKLRQTILKDDKDVEITGAGDHVRIISSKASEEQFAALLRDMPAMLEDISALELL